MQGRLPRQLTRDSRPGGEGEKLSLGVREIPCYVRKSLESGAGVIQPSSSSAGPPVQAWARPDRPGAGHLAGPCRWVRLGARSVPHTEQSESLPQPGRARDRAVAGRPRAAQARRLGFSG